MRAEDAAKIRSIPIFEGIDSDVVGAVTSGAYFQRFPSGTQLLMEGDPVDFLYILLDGQVELSGTWNDKETTLAILQPISTFILAAVVLDAPALMTARTLERCEIAMLHGTQLRSVMSSNTTFGMAVSREMAGCYRGLVRSIKNYKLRGGAERVANYLLALHAKIGKDGNVALPHEKRTLASLLGMTPEYLSRAFSALKQHGVSVSGTKVSIENISALEQVAKPDDLIDNHAVPPTGSMVDSTIEVMATNERRLSGSGHF